MINERSNPEQDEKDLNTIEEILSKFYNDTQELRDIKSQIIKELHEIIKQWMINIAESTHNEVYDFESIGYGMKIFGSFKLKVNSYDGDIDILCVVPDYFSR